MGSISKKFLLLAMSLSAFSCFTCADPRDHKNNKAIGSSDSMIKHSAARQWNDALLEAIRRDLARPTVHARNLFHSSALMYDVWAAYDLQAHTYFLGNPQFNEAPCDFDYSDRDVLRKGVDEEEHESLSTLAMSHAMRAFLKHRFANSPGKEFIYRHTDNVFASLGNHAQDEDQSRDFRSGSPGEKAAALGLYLADCVINVGLSDGSNEQNNYANLKYQPANIPLRPDQSGTPGMMDPNRWQPLELLESIDQSGHKIENIPKFIGAEWGEVRGFSLQDSDSRTFERDQSTWRVYMDPGPPAYLRGEAAQKDAYLWNHTLVALWSSHLDPNDGVMWDISPGSLGNTATLPDTLEDFRSFYRQRDGGVQSRGHKINPKTGQPYAPNLVPRGDYVRVLSEFWADGPESETPPGHWFTIVNKAVNDHPQLVRRFRGEGRVLSPLEWDVKVYFVLGGAMHDAAVTAWGIKGWYDYVRPISAIRFMASQGQSSDPASSNFHPEGLPLQPGLIELISVQDPLAGSDGEHVGKPKLWAWRGANAISDSKSLLKKVQMQGATEASTAVYGLVNEERSRPSNAADGSFSTGSKIDMAGVGWIRAEDWTPYQRPSFVTPPFAGYVSGHSTFSRTAAEILTLFTGDEFFPGGIAEFVAKHNSYLLFEEGPSTDVTLQWATYRDASDQTSLSRIWGGIHPPIDDIPGRKLGVKIALKAFKFGEQHFN